MRGLERMLVLQSSALRGSPLLKVVGASSCNPGQACDLSRGVIVNGESLLTIRLFRADPGLLHELTRVVRCRVAVRGVT